MSIPDPSSTGVSPTEMTFNDLPPAVMDPEWIPPVSGLLGEMRAEHHRFLGQRRAAATALRAVEDRHAAEDEARRAAIRESAATGRPTRPVEVTPHPERVAELREARENSLAVNQALLEFINGAVERVIALAPEELGRLDEADRVIERDIREAQARLRAIESQRGATARLREWLTRTSGTAARTPFMHLQFKSIPAPPPTGSARERWMQETMRESYENPGERYVTERERSEAERAQDEAEGVTSDV